MTVRAMVRLMLRQLEGMRIMKVKRTITALQSLAKGPALLPQVTVRGARLLGPTPRLAIALRLPPNIALQADQNEAADHGPCRDQ